MARRIESKTSRTAEFTCMIRFQSYLEKREHYKSDDDISQVIMNSLFKFLFKLPPVRSYFSKNVYAPGMYEYVIARTKFIDSEFIKTLQEGVEQVLIFGAGFDSRGIRFRNLSKNAVVFELDAPVTQRVKLDRYKEKGIEIPENLVFIPIDFDRESLPQRLEESGFKKGKKSLFILEGLTMYLQPKSVDNTFKLIREISGTGSRVVFDHIYASILRRENLYEGEEELYLGVLKRNEKFCFGIEKGNINAFLYGYGFDALSIMNSDALEDMFFKDAQGKPAARVNGTHCIVTAVKKDRS
jgi:methyltransferase (TIGR00027 family)